MAARPGRSVLSLQSVALADRQFSAHTARLDLELPHGEVALVQVEDEHDAAMLVDLCLGLADPGAGEVRFLGVDWTTRTPRERFHRRRRIGAVVQTDVWPSHMTVLESVLVARAYHFNQPQAEVIADATELARLFGLPGLPVGRRETTPMRALVRAACVRGFLGSPDLIVVQDQVLDQSSELATAAPRCCGSPQVSRRRPRSSSKRTMRSGWAITGWCGCGGHDEALDLRRLPVR
jgi:predicted ABC-type transport system involved in lysophospholipase L1 biosynthesis ATPase subunit